MTIGPARPGRACKEGEVVLSEQIEKMRNMMLNLALNCVRACTKGKYVRV